MPLSNYRTKLRKPILESFKSRLVPMQYQNFATRFNKDKGCGGQCSFRRSKTSFMHVGLNALIHGPASGCRQSMTLAPSSGFPQVDASRLFYHMDATMAGWSVPARSGPPAAAGGAAAEFAARGPASSSGVSAPPNPPPPPQASSGRAPGQRSAAAAVGEFK